MTMQIAVLDKTSINYAQIAPERAFSPTQDIVLLHGLATNMAFWYFGIAKALARYGRITVIDLRGHGHSTMPATGYTADEMAADVHAVLAHLGIERAHMIGHSYGGLVAAAFACAFPASTRSLMLADVRLPSVQPKLQMSAWPRAGAFARHLEAAGIDIRPDDPDFGLELLTQIARLRLQGGADSEKLEGVMGGARRVMGPRAAAKWLKLLDTTSARRDFAFGSAIKPADLRSANAPVYGIYGQNSMTLTSGRALADALPNCRFDVLPKAGHFFPAARPREFAVRAMGFLAEHIGAPARAATPGPGAVAGPHYLH